MRLFFFLSFFFFSFSVSFFLFLCPSMRASAKRDSLLQILWNDTKSKVEWLSLLWRRYVYEEKKSEKKVAFTLLPLKVSNDITIDSKNVHRTFLGIRKKKGFFSRGRNWEIFKSIVSYFLTTFSCNPRDQNRALRFMRTNVPMCVRHIVRNVYTGHFYIFPKSEDHSCLQRQILMPLSFVLISFDIALI